jgi:hypothetical protein
VKRVVKRRRFRGNAQAATAAPSPFGDRRSTRCAAAGRRRAPDVTDERSWE